MFVVSKNNSNQDKIKISSEHLKETYGRAMVRAILEKSPSREFFRHNNRTSFVYHHTDSSHSSVGVIKGESDIVDVITRHFESVRHSVHHEIKPKQKARWPFSLSEYRKSYQNVFQSYHFLYKTDKKYFLVYMLANDVNSQCMYIQPQTKILDRILKPCIFSLSYYIIVI